MEPAPTSAKTSTSAATLADLAALARMTSKAIIAVGAGEQAERQQQRQRAEACHQQIDVSCLHIVALAVVRDHQRPRRQRHELPCHQEAEGVIGEHHQVHSGEISRIERKDPLRRLFVLAVTEREQARGRAAEIDHDQEERRERVDAEMCAEPWQAEWQHTLDVGWPSRHMPPTTVSASVMIRQEA